MSDFSRRDAVRLAAALAVGATACDDNRAAGAEGNAGFDSKLPQSVDELSAMMFTEQVTFQSPTQGRNTQFLKISPAVGSTNPNAAVLVPTAALRLFRSEAGFDEFTKAGGLYWSCGSESGKITFKEAGGLVLVVRDRDGTVRCYSLQFDLRC